MLDRFKLVTQIASRRQTIVSRQDDQLALAIATWQQIVNDSDFKARLVQTKLPWGVPSWQGELGLFRQFEHQKIDYLVVSADGSQIYPDRHMGTNYYLINTGVITVDYHHQVSSSVSMDSNPYFFTDAGQLNSGIVDFIDSKRHELEINAGFKAIMQAKQDLGGLRQDLFFYLADGSLIAWHLFGKNDELCERFLPLYMAQLQDFYQHRIPFIGYISLPNSTDLINLLRAKLSENLQDEITGLVDIDLLNTILQPYQFTTWFKSQVSAVITYPAHLRPYFAYFNSGHEIARIEVPAWIIADELLLDLCMQIIVDQVQKGYGYPVALAEAHQLAVIKTPDRDFFYQTINQIIKQKPHARHISRKLRQKRVMGI
jgi:hypothetical protein